MPLSPRNAGERVRLIVRHKSGARTGANDRLHRAGVPSRLETRGGLEPAPKSGTGTPRPARKRPEGETWHGMAAAGAADLGTGDAFTNREGDRTGSMHPFVLRDGS
jgi:hypothetical protein